jgi:hypothetical protein
VSAAETLAYFGTTTRNLLEAESSAGVRHHMLLSIVGIHGIDGNAHYTGSRPVKFRPSARLLNGLPSCTTAATGDQASDDRYVKSDRRLHRSGMGNHHCFGKQLLSRNIV